MRLNIFNSYTGSLETLIQAGRSNLRVESIPIRVNGPTRPSRLMRSNFHYIRRNGLAMLATYMIYRPVQVFGLLASLMLVPGAVLAARYLWFMARGEGAGHVQSVIASGVLAICGFLMIGLAVLGHLLAINRRLLEDLRYQQRLRRSEMAPHRLDKSVDVVTRVPGMARTHA
jgi:hypothetical protein